MFKDTIIRWMESFLAKATAADVKSEDQELDRIMTPEVNAMNSALFELGIGAMIRKEDILFSRTGGFIRYRVSGPGIKLSKVQSYSGDLQAAINDCRRILPGAAKVIVKWRDGLSFDVPYPLQVLPLLWENIAELKKIQPFQMLIGRNYESEMPCTEFLDYTDESLAHVLVSGGSGSGKSVMLANLIASLCRSTSPDKVVFIILDTKHGKIMKSLSNLPHVILCNEVEECIAAVNAVQVELERRKREGAGETKIFLVLEELADMMAAAEDKNVLWNPLIRLSSTAREFGIYMIACTQFPGTTIIDSAFRTNFLTRIGGQFATDTEIRVATGRDELKASNLTTAGSFYLVHKLKVIRVQSAKMVGKELANQVAYISDLWANVKPYRIKISGKADQRPTTFVEATEQPGSILVDVMGQLDDLCEKYGYEVVETWAGLAIDGKLSSKTIMESAKINGTKAAEIKRKFTAVVNEIQNPGCGGSLE